MKFIFLVRLQLIIRPVTVTRCVNHARGENPLVGEGHQKVTVTGRVNHATGENLLTFLYDIKY